MNIQSSPTSQLPFKVPQGSIFFARRMLCRTLISMGAGCLLAFGLPQPVFAGEFPMVEATHQVVSVETDPEGRTWLTLNVTVTNQDEQDLTNVSLLTVPSSGMEPIAEQAELSIGDLMAMSSNSATWTLETYSIPGSDGHELNDISLAGIGSDAIGQMVTFSVRSVLEVQ